MKVKKILIPILALLLVSFTAFPQDNRTLEIKIADLLAQLPANDLQYTYKLMEDMQLLGDQGMRKICDQIIPSGTGDDTRPRFAAESFSRYLSQRGKENERSSWEKICISYATGQKDNGVRDFFMKQLQLIGGDASVEALKMYLTDKEICGPALGAITAIGGKTAETALAESLKNRDLPCAAAVMNSLAHINSQLAVNEYIWWISSENPDIKASAYHALAKSGSPQAYPVLLKAAKSNSFRWEATGATSSLLTYAQTAGWKGDVATMDRVCKMLMKKCNEDQTVQYKTAALETYVRYHGPDAMNYLFKAAVHPDITYRTAAINMPGYNREAEFIEKWIAFFPGAIPEAQPEILYMLGIRGGEKAIPLLTLSLKNDDPAVRCAAAESLARISGKKAVPQLIAYIMEYDTPEDQAAAVASLKITAGSSEILQLKPVLQNGSPAAKKSVIELMAWNKGQEYFSDVLPFTESSDESLKRVAFRALESIAGEKDQKDLIILLLKTDNAEYVSDIQSALAVAACKTADLQKRSSLILKALEGSEGKEKLVPVLAKTGGRNALAIVLKEFENGTPGMRQICFKALTSWNDHSASSALYEICASGNKTYEAPAFEGYVQQITSASVPDEQKLLLLRKIMPYAFTPERKNEILAQLAQVKTYQSLFFVSGYIDDPSTSSTAAMSAMSIALPSVGEKAGMYGYEVREILTKVMAMLKGQESEYDREMISKYLETIPADEGFVPMFNGKDLEGWQGLVENPVARAKMKPAELSGKQAEADKKVPGNWTVKDGCIWFNGSGDNLCSIKEYGDFEMLVDWKISKEGDSGIYLRGSPQVQIWDTSRVESGAQVGSGGLYNNQKNPSKPLRVADNPVGEWNTFRIIMIGEKVSVWLNGVLVVDDVTMENYWDRNIPIFPVGAIELQAHGTDLAFRDIYVREISDKKYNLK
jgi:HEAT repeat protein